MKGKFRRLDFTSTAAGCYAMAMEQVLSELRQKGAEKSDGVNCTKLASGCLLYRVPPRFWRQR